MMRLYVKSRMVKMCLLVFLLQFLAVMPPLSPQTSLASPALYPDNVWEGVGAPNDNIATAYPLPGSYSMKNDPNTPLNVSSWSPDYYNFTVIKDFYFSVFIEFNQSIAYNTSAQPVVFPTPPPPLDPPAPFLSDIDVEIIAANGTILDTSGWSGDEEVVGPILVDSTQTYVINVSAVNDVYATIQYSTTYNMSVVLEDKFEILNPNDNWSDINDPRDGSTDDEITAGSYPNLRFSSYQPLNGEFSDFGKQDWYTIWLYNNTDITLTVTGYMDGGSTEPDGPDFYIYDYEAIDGALNQLAGFIEDGNFDTDKINYYTNYSGWYYLHFDNRFQDTVDYYELNITIEDSFEGGGNNVNSTAVLMTEGHYPGLVTSTGFDDWYKVEMDEGERLLVQIHWFSFIGTLQLALYENESATSIIGDAAPIFGGLRIGPHRAEKYSIYLIHVSSDNSDPRYYNLTIVKDDVDDWAEDNDDPIHPYMLIPQSKVYKPTIADPFGGFFSQEGDLDFYAISLLAGDYLTIRIDFNGTLGDLNLFLGDSKGNTLDSSVLSPSNSEVVSYRIRRSDVYIFLVGGIAGSYASIGVDYNMSVNILEFDDSFESNDDANNAAPIAEGEYNDLILRDSDDDWFYVYLYASDVIEINLTYVADTYGTEEYLNDIDLDLLNEDHSLANQSRSLFNESLSFVAPTSGKYYIVCVIYGTSNQYNLSINVIETDDAYEDNDDLAHATRIDVIDEIPADPVTHQETNLKMRVKDDDFFVVNVPAGLAIIVDLTFGTGQNLDLELLYPNGSVIDSSRLTVSTAESVGPFPMNQTYTGDFNSTDVYFRVFMDENLATTYVLSITVGPEEILITRETVPPFTSFTIPIKTLGLLEQIAPLVIGGSIIGGGGAGLLYAGKKTGVLDKGIGKFRDWRGGRGGGTGGKTGGTPRKSRRKPPS
ncbi:MAG: PPC domain-containing protein [Candidatus Hodarchaeales archaeon]